MLMLSKSSTNIGETHLVNSHIRDTNAIESSTVETKYWHQLDDGRVQCDLCPRHCQLREGKRGVCFVRQNIDNEIKLTSYGRSSGFCIDPIEKKPLNHFYPGSSVLSFGTAGCNLCCKFCQNWDISKSREFDTLGSKASPESLAATAKRMGCRSIAFTYNDPVIFLEYAVDVAQACHEQGINSVAVTAGYICPEPRVEFYRFMDAANVDLKGFTQDFYHKICSGNLSDVLDTLLYLRHETRVWFEITTLLIPGENDSVKELEQQTKWIADNLGSDIPLHFSAFHPDFHMLDKPRTPSSTLMRAREIAMAQGLNYVYTGNIHDSEGGSSYCPSCHRLVIKRDWYELGEYHLNHSGKCQHCGTQIPGRFDGPCEHFGRNRIPILIG
ncbi:AmmeMemoRadiSam system radical SAM enzyme [Shewanella psychrophila]|uniref:AmmeMemoRadiSam system radical SAM enzyme n=1 Tax=Shewanella psychrophila TaxID=225848 RepID=A0A1S6HVU1_9GAMM|nr:AmmeMemoRadiSam system radical SAM enzyme [Shewanella psychrophila]AQS39687.1 AmmeMemoRadiSam system radical SAM enzyme [Shewanella psychrophila]